MVRQRVEQTEMPQAGELVKLFVPGRLCLFGEHSDWAAQFGLHRGFCLVVGTDQGLAAQAGRGEELSVQTIVPDAGRTDKPRRRSMSCPWTPEALLAATRDEEEFFRYCAGAAYQMMTRHGIRHGLNLQITAMDLPLRKGVSSSAAVCILVARAFDAVYDLRLFPHELMELAYLGERLTGSQCGRMDQACIYGNTPVLLSFQQSSPIRVEPVFSGGRVDMFFVDLAGEKDTIRILADLQAAYPETPPLQQALGADNEQIVRRAYQALSGGSPAELGRLMTEAQELFDARVAPHSRPHLLSPRLHGLLSCEAIAEHIYGGKGVGSQGDGTAQFVARSQEDRQAAMGKISRAFPEMACFPLTIRRQSPV